MKLPGSPLEREAVGLARDNAHWVMAFLKSQRNPGLCRDFMATYAEDKEMVGMIEKLLREMESP